MSYQPASTLATKICEQIGLDPATVTEVTLNLVAGLATITATIVDFDGDQIIETLRTYEIREANPQPEESA